MASLPEGIARENFRNQNGMCKDTKRVKTDKKYCIECSKDNVDQNMNETRRLSEIQQFYDGKNVLITGATGNSCTYLFTTSFCWISR